MRFLTQFGFVLFFWGKKNAISAGKSLAVYYFLGLVPGPDRARQKYYRNFQLMQLVTNVGRKFPKKLDLPN